MTPLEAEAATEVGHQVGQVAAFLFVANLVGKALLEKLRAQGGGAPALRARQARPDGLLFRAVGEALESLSQEERHRMYKLLRLDVRFRPDWPLEISGIFAEVAEEEETCLSYRNPSPRSV